MAASFRSTGIATKVIAGTRIAQFPVNSVTFSIERLKPVLNEAHKFTAPINSRLEKLFFGHTATKSINVTVRRYLHTDVQFPSFDEYRRSGTLDSKVPARVTEDWRRSTLPAVYYGVGGMTSILAAKEAAQFIAYYKWMPADQQALASIEINMDEIPEGELKTYEWRGKPVFVKHRTADEIAREREASFSDMRDPEKDEDRVQRDEWLVVIGVCTHLGCVPMANAGEYNGYFCPCHGSHYDGSGRIRKGPAPTNLEVPLYKIREDNVIVVGAK